MFSEDVGVLGVDDTPNIVQIKTPKTNSTTSKIKTPLKDHLLLVDGVRVLWILDNPFKIIPPDVGILLW